MSILMEKSFIGIHKLRQILNKIILYYISLYYIILDVIRLAETVWKTYMIKFIK